jgi:tRNA dimethylallyltransferase
MTTARPEAYVLVGPTATGKTAVAHLLAADLNAVILSADAMLVYRGMDIGTAKPTAAERARFGYGGLDLVEPGASFDVAAWLDHAKIFLARARAAGRPVIVVGGTGLYVKCLLTGLTAQPDADPVWRAAAAKLNLAELQAHLQKLDAARFAAMTESDQQNPRRLIRAVELARGDKQWSAGVLECWSNGKEQPRTMLPACVHPKQPFSQYSNTPILQHSIIPGLALPPPVLAQRIQERVAAMFAQGLLDEAQKLHEKFPQLSATAQQAIGYAEAFAVLDGRCTAAEAQEKICARTRQLAKRQMTWFKHQASVVWVAAEAPVAEVAARVRQLWSQHGPTPLAY